LLEIWTQAEQDRLTPFTAGDFLMWNMRSSDTNGVHVKQFLNDPAGGAWLAKSGALNEAFLPTHTPAVERGRRAAFPLNEALASLIYAQAGIKTNEVGLGLRTMFVRPTGTWEPLLTSFHRMEHGKLRDKIGAFERSEDYILDIFCMAIVDVIIGQRDHKWHNFMVTPDGRLFLFDNSDCMHEDQLRNPPDLNQFEEARMFEPERPPWTDSVRAGVVTRISAITPKFIDDAFASMLDLTWQRRCSRSENG
jgi:hypothetical protein